MFIIYNFTKNFYICINIFLLYIFCIYLWKAFECGYKLEHEDAEEMWRGGWDGFV